MNDPAESCGISKDVMPVKTGIHLDSLFRGNDGIESSFGKYSK